MADATPLAGLEIFKGLTDDELGSIAGIMSERSLEKGEVLFAEGMHGDSIFVVLEGEVEVTIVISEGVTESVAVVRDGSYVGEMALVDPGDRSATATAVTDCRVLTLTRRDFFELAAQDNALGIKVFLNLAITLTERLRQTTNAQRRAMVWGHQVSGAANLNFWRLISDKVNVTVELLTGKSIECILLKVDETKSGHELTLRATDDSLHVVPYHAIAQIMIGADQLATDS